MKRGPNLAMKVYRKPTHTGRYLHFKSNHPHHVKRGVAQSLVSRAKVICQDRKDFNREIKNIIHDLILNEYPQEFIDSITKLERSNRPSSDTIYQSTVIIPYVRGISENFRCIGNRFNVRTIFKMKYTFCGTLMKPGPVGDAQQTKQCVYSEYGRCYMKQADLWKFMLRSTNTT
jgi:hypothetical protein